MNEQPQTEDRNQSEPQTFEQSLQRLEEIVGRLEEGHLPLDESLELYEQGIGAYRRCQELLQDAGTRVQKLVETLEGELKEEPFDVPTTGGDEPSESGGQSP
ncbi:MAG: exodeoxyribonuclease VII small subunit [Candidatus Brocadiia bacterium]